MKIFLEPIDVHCSDGRPALFRWRGRDCHIHHIADTWTYRSSWWAMQEDYREYMLVLTSHGQMEIYRNGDGWILSRLFD